MSFEAPSRLQLAVVCFVLAGALWSVWTPSSEFPAGTSISTGDSMGDTEPSLLFYVQGQPEIGDTILFKTPSGWVHHRVVGETTVGGVPAWVTQGDNRERADKPLAKSSWTAVVLFEVPLRLLAYVGSLALFGVAVHRLWCWRRAR